MQGQEPAYTASTMTKEQFFYAYKQLAHENDRHLFLKVDAAERYVWPGLIRLRHCKR